MNPEKAGPRTSNTFMNEPEVESVRDAEDLGAGEEREEGEEVTSSKADIQLKAADN